MSLWFDAFATEPLVASDPDPGQRGRGYIDFSATVGKLKLIFLKFASVLQGKSVANEFFGEARNYRNRLQFAGRRAGRQTRMAKPAEALIPTLFAELIYAYLMFRGYL